jgi:hypothetical protein
MPHLSPDAVIVLARIAFLVAAVTDGLALVPMLLPRVAAALFGGGGASSATPQSRYAMNLAASLMAGWTTLLFWGAAAPIERRAILLIVVCPSILGIVLASIKAARQRVVQARRMAPLWVHLGVLSAYCLLAYALSCKAAP